MMILLIVGQSQQRTQGFQSALERQLALAKTHAIKPAQSPTLKIISYDTLIHAIDANGLAALFEPWFTQHEHVFIKLDAPAGESLSWQLVQLAVAKNNQGESPLTQKRHGELAHQHLFYEGFCHLLDQLTAAVNHAIQRTTNKHSKTRVSWLNHPNDIKTLCDKWQCTQQLNQHALVDKKIDIPQPIGLVTHFDAMQTMLEQQRIHQVFIKSRFGSSGSGILAYRYNNRGQQVAYTNAICQFVAGKWRVFNTLKPQRLTDKASIARLVSALAPQGLYVEKWVPKPQAVPFSQLNGKAHHFDVRMVSMLGHAKQRIARLSTHPLTNLHLGNERVALDTLLSQNAIDQAEQCVHAASKVFSQSNMIGFDVIIRPQKPPCIIEANAFGDLLINLTWQGNTTWDDQVQYMLQQRLKGNRKAT